MYTLFYKITEGPVEEKNLTEIMSKINVQL